MTFLATYGNSRDRLLPVVRRAIRKMRSRCAQINRPADPDNPVRPLGGSCTSNPRGFVALLLVAFPLGHGATWPLIRWFSWCGSTSRRTHTTLRDPPLALKQNPRSAGNLGINWRGRTPKARAITHCFSSRPSHTFAERPIGGMATLLVPFERLRRAWLRGLVTLRGPLISSRQL